MIIAGFSKMIAAEFFSLNAPFETKLNVYNLDAWDHHQQCNALPKLPGDYIPFNAELLNGILVVCATENAETKPHPKCSCHKLIKGVWVAVPTPPTSECIYGAGTSTLTMRSMLLFFDFVQ